MVLLNYGRQQYVFNAKLTPETQSSRQKRKAHARSAKLTPEAQSSRQKRKVHVRNAKLTPEDMLTPGVV